MAEAGDKIWVLHVRRGEPVLDDVLVFANPLQLNQHAAEIIAKNLQLLNELGYEDHRKQIVLNLESGLWESAVALWSDVCSRDSSSRLIRFEMVYTMVF